ncbi:hypothetical protein VFPBJ_00970 [Purpureocillium lilacinum]|uniref:Uncharacterized protein n=1 Tax=Purpureocillium lilacinum TaxID=33203 RepID=A0A179HBK7_PURLI|nr:hypothetical protein VFPBJ_00970 [Purpureocillium lilacinum]
MACLEVTHQTASCCRRHDCDAARFVAGGDMDTGQGEQAMAEIREATRLARAGYGDRLAPALSAR